MASRFAQIFADRAGDSQDLEVRATPVEELDTRIRAVLWSSFENAEPSPAAWGRIHRYILGLRWSPGREFQPIQHSVEECEMLTWSDLLVQKECRKDLLREVEQYRLVQQALSGRKKYRRFYCRALIWLGHRLVAWGYRLQERYSAATPLPEALHVAVYPQG